MKRLGLGWMLSLAFAAGCGGDGGDAASDAADAVKTPDAAEVTDRAEAADAADVPGDTSPFDAGIVATVGACEEVTLEETTAWTGPWRVVGATLLVPDVDAEGRVRFRAPSVGRETELALISDTARVTARVVVEPLETGPELAPGCPPFRQGVASGDPRPDSVLLWTRLSPEEDETLGPDNVLLDGLDQAFLDVNPHYAWADLTRHGYGLLDVTPERVVAEMWFSPILGPAESESFGRGVVVSAGAGHWSRELRSEPTPPAE